MGNVERVKEVWDILRELDIKPAILIRWIRQRLDEQRKALKNDSKRWDTEYLKESYMLTNAEQFYGFFYEYKIHISCTPAKWGQKVAITDEEERAEKLSQIWHHLTALNLDTFYFMEWMLQTVSQEYDFHNKLSLLNQGNESNHKDVLFKNAEQFYGCIVLCLKHGK